MIAPFGRTGGKHYLSKTIIRYFPNGYEEMTYIEPFCGAASMFFRKNPSVREILNDIDPIPIQLLQGFKDYPELAGEQIIIRDKDEFKEVKESMPDNEKDQFIRLLKLTKFSFGNKCTHFNALPKHNNLYRIIKNVNHRLDHVTLLNKDYREIIREYDSPNSLFFIDPPYEGSTASHYQFSQFNIDELFEILQHVQGKWILSFNKSDHVMQLFADYTIHEVKTRYSPINGCRVGITELLITSDRR